MGVPILLFQIPYSFTRTHLIGYDVTTRANHVTHCKRGTRHWREVQMINSSASLIIFGVHQYIDFLEEGVNEEKLFKYRGCSHANKLFLMKHHVFFSFDYFLSYLIYILLLSYLLISFSFYLFHFILFTYLDHLFYFTHFFSGGHSSGRARILSCGI